MQLFEHQQQALGFHNDRPHSLDLSEVGVGKSAPLILWLQQKVHEGKIKKALIICPNSIIQNWQVELARWSNLRSIALIGSKEKRIALLQQPNISDVYVLNFEGVRVVAPQLFAAHFDAIICDEVHHIKSPSAEQTKLILKMARTTPYRKGMTGTLLTNGVMDPWAICQFIDPTIFNCNQWGYRSRFLFNVNATKPWMKFPDWQPKPGAVEAIKSLIAPYTIRFAKREVLKFLPPVLFQRRTVTMEGEQRRVYNALKRDYVVELEHNEELAALQVLPRLTKLLEITSGFAYREGESTWRFEHNAKLAELKSLLEEIGDHKVVIWVAFKEDAALVGQILVPLGTHAFITGATRQDERQNLVDRFNGGDLQYLVCNAQCAGEGLTILTEYSIYYSRSYKLGERIQSLGRHDRPGSERFENVTVIDLVTENSVDEEVMKALDNKEDLLKTINPESFRRMLTQ